MKVLWSDQHTLHSPSHEFLDGQLQPYLESPERLEIIRAALEPNHEFQTPDQHPDLEAMVAAVHDADYLEWLQTGFARWRTVSPQAGDVMPCNFVVRGFAGFDPKRSSHPYALAGYYATDTSATLTATTHEAAFTSANLALAGAQMLSSRQTVYALCRPPGHHAMRGTMGGYCFLNNAAVAAEYLAQNGTRVALLDVDYHHGNGTQDIFYQRDDVLTISIHADPSFEYPYYLGYEDEVGAGAGLGYNLNLPLPAKTGWAVYRPALQTALARVRAFGAEVLVVSAGFDTFLRDPLGTFLLESPDFTRLAQDIAALKLPTLIVQEGGYATSDLGRNAAAFLAGFSSP